MPQALLLQVDRVPATPGLCQNLYFCPTSYSFQYVSSNLETPDEDGLVEPKQNAMRSESKTTQLLKSSNLNAATAYIHTYIHTYMYTCILTYIHTLYIHTLYIHNTYIHYTYIIHYTHINTYIHTYSIRMYTYIHTHII
jgi:hypothetical protein